MFRAEAIVSSLIMVSLVSLMGVVISPWELGQPVEATHGMVVSTNRLASEVGVEILKKGGNAVDAAVATAFALAVTFPSAGNIGGGGFMLIRWAKTGRAVVVDYREEAPGRAERDMYLNEKGEVIPYASTLGYLSIGVPGTVAGLSLALERYGRMSLPEVMAPAIRLAEEGFVVTPSFSRSLERNAPRFSRFPSTRAIFLKNGKPYQPGELFCQPDLARTLKLIAKEGPSAFYRGEIARLIVKEMERGGGLITLEDLASYKAYIRQPIKGGYRGYEILSVPPPSSGGVALLQLLNILEGFDLPSMGHNTPESISLMVEAEKIVYADRAEYLGDPGFVQIPVQGLISKQYAADRRKKINLFHATPSDQIKHGLPPLYESEETTHFSVVDRQGNAVANTYTLNGGYGSKVAVEGAGFLLNNEMDDFSSKPGYPNIYGLIGGEANAIAPHKRMLSSMTPTILLKDGKLFMVIGTPGGSTIITTVLQVILNVINHRMNIQEAVAAPRVHHQWTPDLLYIEKDTLPGEVLRALIKRGYQIKERGSIGDAHGILVDPTTGKLWGGADPRMDGVAVGY